MIDLFEMSKRLIEKLNNPKKEYWEDKEVTWNREALGPNGELYDEKEIYEAIVESDRKRLLKYQ